MTSLATAHYVKAGQPLDIALVVNGDGQRLTAWTAQYRWPSYYLRLDGVLQPARGLEATHKPVHKQMDFLCVTWGGRPDTEPRTWNGIAAVLRFTALRATPDTNVVAIAFFQRACLHTVAGGAKPEQNNISGSWLVSIE